MPTLEQARAWYALDPVHGYDHIVRVYRLAEKLARLEGADLEIVLAAALLHDADPSQEVSPSTAGSHAPGIHAHEAGRANHQHASAGFARQVLAQENWPDDRIAAVEHCIRAHRFRDHSEQPATLEARVLFDADKLDAIGAIGVARAVAYAARAGQPAYASPSTGFLATGQKEPGEPHSAYHEYLFKLRKLKGRLFTASGKALADRRHQLMETFFEELAEEVNAQV